MARRLDGQLLERTEVGTIPLEALLRILPWLEVFRHAGRLECLVLGLSEGL